MDTSVHKINPVAVADIVAKGAQMLGAGKYTIPEVITALAELSGRTIVAQDITPIAMGELATLSAVHMGMTIKCGASVKGWNMENVPGIIHVPHH